MRGGDEKGGGNKTARVVCISEVKAFARYASFVYLIALQDNLSSCDAFAAIAATAIIAAAAASTAAIMSQPQAPRGAGTAPPWTGGSPASAPGRPACNCRPARTAAATKKARWKSSRPSLRVWRRITIDLFF